LLLLVPSEADRFFPQQSASKIGDLDLGNVMPSPGVNRCCGEVVPLLSEAELEGTAAVIAETSFEASLLVVLSVSLPEVEDTAVATLPSSLPS
jgi:hypothetical protein